jgi:hypothetical protein
MESPGGTPADMAGNKRKRGANYTDEECVQICRTWLHIGDDPIQGSGQKSGAFWKRMHKHFTENKPPGSVWRSWRSLESKWSDIQHDTKKFTAAYASVEGKDEWDTNEMEKVDKALKLYKEQHPKNDTYDYVQCWYILRNSPKFLQYIAGEPAFPKHQEPIDGVDMTMDGQDRAAALRSAKRPKILNKNQQRSADRNLRIISEAQRIKAEAIQLQTHMSLFTTPLLGLDEEATEFFQIQRAQVLEKLRNELQTKSSAFTPLAIEGLEDEPESTAQEQVDLGSSVDELV